MQVDAAVWAVRRLGRVHFIGIGGSGMGALAQLLLQMGCQVSGSDAKSSPMTESLEALGAAVGIGHRRENIHGADLVVISSAVNDANEELREATAQGLCIIKRGQLLAELMRHWHGIAVAGTHGKTTTTSLLTSVLQHSGLNPSYAIGGKLLHTDRSAELGTSPWFVAEADESDASFLWLTPTIAVVTNIDEDHMATYGGEVDQLKQAFVDFIHRLPLGGLAIVCQDSAYVQDILPKLARKTLSYGESAQSDYRITDIKREGLQTNFSLLMPSGELVRDITINMPGEKSVANAAVALIVASVLGQDIDLTKAALAQFQGVGRRLQRYGRLTVSMGSVLVLDDYGHHPEELAVTFNALKKAYPQKRLVVAFQPHRYTRTRDLFDQFVEVLKIPDVLLLSEVYAAGETPIEGVSALEIKKCLDRDKKSAVYHFSTLNDLKLNVCECLQNDDILLTQGAGDIGTLAPSLMDGST